MIHSLKKRLYFSAAAYFGFWAKIVLKRWKPRIIVITGSAGKTTLLHLAEAQLGDKAIYTHNANSTFGIPFYILGIKTGAENRKAWPFLFLRAPFCIFRSLPKQQFLVVEADSERPKEGEFLAQLLKPEVTLWISLHKTHSGNFDKLVKEHAFTSHNQAIAYEFGNFLANTTKLAIINKDYPEQVEQLSRVNKNVEVKQFSLKQVKSFSIENGKTTFKFENKSISLAGLHPEELGVSLQMIDQLMDYLGFPADNEYKNLKMPPGRSSVFKGKNNLTIIDSTYNTAFGALKVIVDLFAKYPAKHKWLIIGDFLEQGSLEEQEHIKLGEYVAKQKADKVVLLGSRTHKYAYPILQKTFGANVISFETPKEVLDYLVQNLKGGEVLLFKGSRFLEGVIEQLLENPLDSQNLVRRGKIWTKRRQKWGLPK